MIDALRNAKSGTIGDAVRDAKDNPLSNHGGDRKQDQADNVILNQDKYGNSKTYTLRRLARDAPELLPLIESGELSAKIKAKIRELLPAKPKSSPRPRGDSVASPAILFAPNTVTAYRKIAANVDKIDEFYEAVDDVPTQAAFMRHCVTLSHFQ